MKFLFLLTIAASSITASNSPGLSIRIDGTSIEFWDPQNPQKRGKINGLLNVAQVAPIGLRLALLMTNGTLAITREPLLNFEKKAQYNFDTISLLEGRIKALVLLANGLIAMNDKKLTVITGAEYTVVPVSGGYPAYSMELGFYNGFNERGLNYPQQDGFTFATARSISQHRDNSTIFELITNLGETEYYQTQESQVVRLSPRT